MWRKQTDAVPSSSGEGLRPAGVAAPADVPSREPARTIPSAGGTQIGKTISIRGDISGREDIFLDGAVDGNVRVEGGRLTVGPAGRVRADLDAREIEVQGSVNGMLLGHERVHIGRTGRLSGDVVTQRIAVEDGAIIHGNVDIARPGQKATRTQQAQKPEISKQKPSESVQKAEVAPVKAEAGSQKPTVEKPVVHAAPARLESQKSQPSSGTAPANAKDKTGKTDAIVEGPQQLKAVDVTPGT
ncbi:MAG: bactofilin family protein [Candidatus Acidiferrales bacterium]